jgi:hypothetical protein
LVEEDFVEEVFFVDDLVEDDNTPPGLVVGTGKLPDDVTELDGRGEMVSVVTIVLTDDDVPLAEGCEEVEATEEEVLISVVLSVVADEEGTELLETGVVELNPPEGELVGNSVEMVEVMSIVLVSSVVVSEVAVDPSELVTLPKDEEAGVEDAVELVTPPPGIDMVELTVDGVETRVSELVVDSMMHEQAELTAAGMPEQFSKKVGIAEAAVRTAVV